MLSRSADGSGRGLVLLLVLSFSICMGNARVPAQTLTPEPPQASPGLEPRPEGPAPQVFRPPGEAEPEGETPHEGPGELRAMAALVFQPIALLARAVTATVAAVIWIPTAGRGNVSEDLLESSVSGPWWPPELRNDQAASRDAASNERDGG